MMTSSIWNIFRVTGHFCGEFTGHRWIPRTKASDAELWCDLWSAPEWRLSKQSRGWWFETPLRPLWRHSNVPLPQLNMWVLPVEWRDLHPVTGTHRAYLTLPTYMYLQTKAYLSRGKCHNIAFTSKSHPKLKYLKAPRKATWVFEHLKAKKKHMCIYMMVSNISDMICFGGPLILTA